MPASTSFVTNILDLLRPWGGVSARRMFGGYGLYRQGVIFAIVADDVLYLKTDERNRSDFLAAGMAPFAYRTRRKMVALGYYEAPPGLLDDAEEILAWARDAYGAALRARKPATPLAGNIKSRLRHITKI